MREEAFEEFLALSAKGYADDNIRSGRWPGAGSLERAAAELAESLPNGIHTPDNYIFEIAASQEGASVGYIWFAVRDQYGQRSAFIYDVEIKPEFRRQGYATAAFEAVEKHVAALGIQTVGLHVFAFNEGALALYKKLGFQVTGVNMQKILAGSPGQ